MAEVFSGITAKKSLNISEIICLRPVSQWKQERMDEVIDRQGLDVLLRKDIKNWNLKSYLADGFLFDVVFLGALYTNQSSFVIS